MDESTVSYMENCVGCYELNMLKDLLNPHLLFLSGYLYSENAP